MTLRRVEDFLGNPIEYAQAWSFSGVESLSDDEKDALAKEAVEGKAKQWVQERNAAGQAMEFDHVELVANRNTGGEIHTILDGKRTHRCWGTGIGYLYIKVG